MNRKFIVTKKQLKEYVDKKKSDKTFYDIIERLYVNSKMLNENISQNKVNQSVIDDFKRKNLITPTVFDMLVKFKIMNENYQKI